MNLPATSATTVITLPATSALTAPMLAALTQALGVPRNVLAADDQIEHAWTNLPRLLARIPPEHRSETLVRMCVAVATGLFDSAINYAWNAAIIELREKVMAALDDVDHAAAIAGALEATTALSNDAVALTGVSRETLLRSAVELYDGHSRVAQSQ